MTRYRDGRLTVLATAMLTNPAGVLGAITPAIVTCLTLEAHLPLTTAARLVAVEFTAMTVAMMLVSPMAGRVGDRVLAALAISVTVAAQLCSLAGDVLLVSVARGCLGFGEGLLYGLAIAALARMPLPERAFGIVVLSNQTVGALLLTLATLAHLRFPSFGIFALLIAFLLFTALCVPALPVTGAARGSSARVDIRHLLVVAPGIIGILLFAAGFGAVWPMIAPIARARGLDDGAIGHLLSLAGIMGIAGAACAILLATRFGRVLPLTCGSLGFGFALLGSVCGPLWLAVPAILLFWSFLVPYYLGSAAAAACEGGFVALAGSMLPLGIAAGQMVASYILGGRSFLLLGTIAGGMVGFAVLCMLLLRRQAERTS